MIVEENLSPVSVLQAGAGATGVPGREPAGEQCLREGVTWSGSAQPAADSFIVSAVSQVAPPQAGR